MAQVVTYLPSKNEALSSDRFPHTHTHTHTKDTCLVESGYLIDTAEPD
jgi:hypothetical protein